MCSAFRKVRTSCRFLSSFTSFALSDYAGPVFWGKAATRITVKRRVVKLSLVTEAHGKRLVFVAFSRPCGSELPVLEASNTAVSMHSLYSIQYMVTSLLNFASAFPILPASRDEWFQPARNGAEPTRSTKQLLAPTTFNRFQVPGETMEDEFEIRLVGDSLVRGQLVEFSGHSSNSRRKRFFYSRLDDITAACEDVTSEADHNTLFIIHPDTNDVKTTRSEELLDKYRRMIK